MMICGAHFPFPGAGTFTKDGTGYACPSPKFDAKCGRADRPLAIGPGGHVP